MIAALMAPLTRAEDVIARIDERARRSTLREGWQLRLLYAEAVAGRLDEGELVDLESLVLLDNGALHHAMTPDLSAAWHGLKVIRHAAAGDPRRLLALPRPGEETDAADGAGAPHTLPDFFFDPAWGEAARLAAWRSLHEVSAQLPPVLAAAVVIDAWQVLEPEQRGGWRAPLIGALVLKDRRKTPNVSLPIALGRRHARYRAHPAHSQADRLAGILSWMVAAAEQADRELDRLTLAEGLLARRLAGRRRDSRLKDLAQLLLSRPLVSIPMAAKALRCSAPAVAKMLRELGSGAREVTGRGRYRCWRVG